jgi:hypothetical protein
MFNIFVYRICGVSYYCWAYVLGERAGEDDKNEGERRKDADSNHTR